LPRCLRPHSSRQMSRSAPRILIIDCTRFWRTVSHCPRWSSFPRWLQLCASCQWVFVELTLCRPARNSRSSPHVQAGFSDSFSYCCSISFETDSELTCIESNAFHSYCLLRSITILRNARSVIDSVAQCTINSILNESRMRFDL
jgi:hypothetical protein